MIEIRVWLRRLRLSKPAQLFDNQNYQENPMTVRYAPRWCALIVFVITLAACAAPPTAGSDRQLAEATGAAAAAAVTAPAATPIPSPAALPTSVPPEPTPVLPEPTPVAAPTGPVTPLARPDDAGLQAARTDFLAARAGYREVVFDTFDNEGTKRRWSPVDDRAFARQLVFSYYQLTLKQPNLTTADIWKERALGGNYIVELSVAFADPTAGRASVGIVYDAQPDGRSFSAFLISSDGTWETVTYQDQAPVLERFVRMSTDTLAPGQGTNILRVVRTPLATQLWVNDVPVATVAPGAFNGGAIGVMAVADPAVAAPVSVIADNLLVLEGAP